jgi:tetratricopeptide (TPR) repeat protein
MPLDDRHLEGLGPRFLAALDARANGRVDFALDELREILKIEPRLAEPRMEVARILLEFGQLEPAEGEVREALRILEAGGSWTEDVPEHVVLAMAWALLGEILKERASSDEVVFGEAEAFRALLAQSRAAFARAAELDPSDTVSGLNAAELGDGEEA